MTASARSTMQKKICLLGAFAVGKTSLVRRFVEGIFSERYLTTIGVKLDAKSVIVDDISVKLILWDIHGDDEFAQVRMSYLRGAAGFLLVVDGTRRHTLEVALKLKSKVEQAMGKLPCLVLLNKKDLVAEWELDDNALAGLDDSGLAVINTSAKTGEGVEEAFLNLARRVL